MFRNGLLNEIKRLKKQIPVKNSYNLATEEGREAYRQHSDGMVGIENAISKAITQK